MIPILSHSVETPLEEPWFVAFMGIAHLVVWVFYTYFTVWGYKWNSDWRSQLVAFGMFGGLYFLGLGTVLVVGFTWHETIGTAWKSWWYIAWIVVAGGVAQLLVMSFLVRRAHGINAVGFALKTAVTGVAIVATLQFFGGWMVENLWGPFVELPWWGKISTVLVVMASIGLLIGILAGPQADQRPHRGYN